MTEPNEQYAYFTVAGNFDPDAMSRIAGTNPTECWRKGDRNPRTQRERRTSRWSLYSRLDRQKPLEAHLEDVIQQLDSNKPSFLEISSKYGAVIQLVAYFKTDYPGLHLPEEIIQSLAYYRLSMDFDFYWWYSDAREDS